MSQDNYDQASNSQNDYAAQSSRNDIEQTQTRLTESQFEFIRSVEDIYSHSQTPTASSQSEDSFWANSQQSCYRLYSSPEETVYSQWGANSQVATSSQGFQPEGTSSQPGSSQWGGATSESQWGESSQHSSDSQRTLHGSNEDNQAN